MAKAQETYKYKVVTRLTADKLGVAEYKSDKSFDDIAFILNHEHYAFLKLDNVIINKKDIISIQPID